MTAAIEFRGLRYAYPDGTEALTGLTLAIAPGERVAILGPNGAGKTTLLLLTIGLLEPDGGDVFVAGTRVTPETAREARRRVGLVFQDPDDQLFMTTVRDDVAFGPANDGMRGDALEARVRDALAAVGMADAGTGRPTTSASANGVASRSRPFSRWSRRRWHSTSRRRTSTRSRGPSSRTFCGASAAPSSW